MPPKAKVVTKTCREIVRTVGGNREHCGVEYTGEKCPQPDPHLTRLKTGACGANWCEGTKAVDWRGNPAPTCVWWETCPCDCHDMLSKMFAISDMERIAVDNSGYKVVNPYWSPSPEEKAQWAAERRARLNGEAPDAPIIIESPAPGIVPPVVARSFRPTVSGRAARGELEAQINRVCGEWLVEKYPWPCTPLYISERIAKDEGLVRPPSTGAITAAMDKWVKLDYAVVLRKPLRFERYTEKGIELGLDTMKDMARRKREQIRSEVERGLRR